MKPTHSKVYCWVSIKRATASKTRRSNTKLHQLILSRNQHLLRCCKGLPLMTTCDTSEASVCSKARVTLRHVRIKIAPNNGAIKMQMRKMIDFIVEPTNISNVRPA